MIRSSYILMMCVMSQLVFCTFPGSEAMLNHSAICTANSDKKQLSPECITIVCHFFTSMSSILLYKHSNNNVSPPGICTCILKVLCTIAQSNKSARKLPSCILFHDRMICTYDVIMMRLRLGISSQMTLIYLQP